MSLTDSEIILLEQLLKEEEVDELFSRLTEFNDKTNPNYKILFEAINHQKWGFDEKNRPKLLYGFAGVALEGSSRSGKTWSGVDIIIWLATDKHKDEGCTINIYRETYNEFKTTLYDDFKRRLDDFGLHNPFHLAKEVPSFRIGKTTVHFLGDGKHGGGCDYAFFNEAMMIRNEVFDQVEMRCRKFWWMDYNPSFTEHWVFDKVLLRDNVAFLRTTFLDNLNFIAPNEYTKIMSYEPWLPGSYEVTEDGVYYNYEQITETNQPPIHPTNVIQGTADEFMWKVYGLGLRGAMKGVIFPSVTWIDSFPEEYKIYCNDFGFTSDPNALNGYYEDENNIYIEPLLYESIETADILGSCLEKLDVSTNDLVICDSSDKHVSEKNGTVQMVTDLIDLGWNAMKVSKTKSVTYHLLSMKKKKIHIVKNHLYKKVKKEVENYKWREINGIMINQPIDKFNHFWDAARYGHMAWNSNQELEADWN